MLVKGGSEKVYYVWRLLSILSFASRSWVSVPYLWRNAYRKFYLFICFSSSLPLSSSAYVSVASRRAIENWKRTIVSAEFSVSNQTNPIHETRTEEVSTNRIKFEFHSLRFLGLLPTIAPIFAADPFRVRSNIWECTRFKVKWTISVHKVKISLRNTQSSAFQLEINHQVGGCVCEWVSEC